MSRSPFPPRRTGATPDSDGEREGPVSKTRRKAEMHALQDIGEALVRLEPRQLAALFERVELPERLREAIVEARAITAWGGRKRQLQYIGKLMREIDPEPVHRFLDELAHGRQRSAAQQHALERWRERLLEEPDALDALAATHPELDRTRFRALVARAREERANATPPHAYRELFRALTELMGRDASISRA